MFSTEHLYNLFKPHDNSSLITEYEVVIGGTNLTANLDKGAIVLTPLFSNVMGSQFKDLKNIVTNLNEPVENGFIREYSLIKHTYQVDIYKVNSPNVFYIEAEREALKIREWLKSYEVMEYLAELNCEVLPCYSTINFTSELYNKKFTNRAFFDFEIISLIEIQEETKIADKAKIENILTLDYERSK